MQEYTDIKSLQENFTPEEIDKIIFLITELSLMMHSSLLKISKMEFNKFIIATDFMLNTLNKSHEYAKNNKNFN